MLFMVVFPICTVLALLADPQPDDARGGGTSTTLPFAAQTGTARELAAWLPSRLPLFWPTVHFRRWLFAQVVPRTSKSSREPSVSHPRSAAQLVGGAWTPAPPAPLHGQASAVYRGTNDYAQPRSKKQA